MILNGADVIVKESKYPVLVLSFNNCGLHCCHLDGYKHNKEALLNRLALIESFFDNKPKSERYRIWYNVDDSNLSGDMIEKIAQGIIRINDNVIKLAFIGAGKYRRSFKKILSKSTFDKPAMYFKDAELAKEWLV